MKHIPNVIDMAHIIAEHALISRKDDIKIYGYNKEGILFELYSRRVADPDNPENVIYQEYTNNQHKNHNLPDKIYYIPEMGL